MSEPTDVPELSPEAKAFLAQHERTGEPSTDALSRVRARLVSPVRALSPAPMAVAPVKRSWLRHEVMAAAAVLVAVVGGQGLYLAYRTHADPGATAPEVKAVVEAYRAGDLEGAQRLASQSCRAAACGPLSSSLARALGLARRLDTLSPEELQQLASLDAELAEGTETALGLQVAQRRNPASSLTAVQLYTEAMELNREKNFEQAALRLDTCIQVDRLYHPCYRLQGSVHAGIAARDASAADMEKARWFYERFLVLAPPDDEYVPKVKAILEAAGPREPEAPSTLSLVSLSEPTTEEVPDEASQAVVGLYRSGDLSGALALASSSSCRQSMECVGLAIDLKAFEERSKGTSTMSTDELLSLSDLDERISGGIPSQRGQALHAQIIEQLLRTAFEDRAADDWEPALQKSQRVLKLDPNNARARGLVQEARNEARELYLRGYQLKDSNPAEAAGYFRRVLSVSLPSDDTYQKATSRLAELGDEPDTSATEAALPADLIIRLGRTRKLQLVGIQRVAIGDPDIADVSVAGTHTIVIKGVKRGQTTLLVWLASGQRLSTMVHVR